jgi:hypothetical protein
MTQEKAVQPSGRQEEKKDMPQIQKGKIEIKKRPKPLFIDLQYGNY